ncbi:MAG: PAS domain-containing protein, partial [Chloroflexota bacterium]|nr:PAS domain-containing protein [Chloroflexota bacterium]
MSVTKPPVAAADARPSVPPYAALRLDNDPDLRALVAGLQVGILVQGPGAEILFHNATAAELLGRPSEQLIGNTSFNPTWRLFYPDGRPLPSAAIPVVEAIATSRPVHNVVMGLERLVQEDCVWLLVDADPQLAADGSVLQVICTFRDITAYQAALTAVAESVLRFQAVSESASDAIVAADSRGRLVFWNGAAQTIFGYTKAEIIGQPLTRLMPKRYQAACRRGMARYLAQSRTVRHRRGDILELHGRRKDGSEFPLDLTISPWQTAEGVFCSCLIRDTTARTQAAQALRASEDRYRQMFENNPQPLWVHDQATLRFLAVNDRALAHYGYSRAEFLALQVSDLLLPEDQGDLPKRFAAGAVAPELVGAVRHRCKDGALYWMDMTAHVMLFEGRAAYLVLSTDITERKQAERALQESEARYWRLVDQSPESIVVHDGVTILYANSATLAMLGLTNAEELIGRPALDFFRGEDRPLVQQRMRQVFQQELPTPSIILPLVRPDRQELVVQVSGIPIQYQGRPAVQVILQDITEQTRVAAALRDSEARYRSLIETSPDAVVVMDLSGHILLCNQQGALLHGVTQPADLVGTSVLTFVAPVDQAQVQAALQHALLTGSVYNIEYTLIRPNGSHCAVEFNATLLRDATGASQTLLAIKRDVSARKQAEQALR